MTGWTSDELRTIDRRHDVRIINTVLTPEARASTTKLLPRS
jgi:hypothetical protein